jgi:hypothetical protein
MVGKEIKNFRSPNGEKKTSQKDATDSIDFTKEKQEYIDSNAICTMRIEEKFPPVES